MSNTATIHNLFTGQALSSDKRVARDYQAKAIQSVRQAFMAGKRRVVLMLPTGAGKSFIAAKIIEAALARGSSVMFTVPRIALIDQTIEQFEREEIKHIGVIQATHPRTDWTAPVQIASVQSLDKRLLRQQPPALVIIDECHINSKVIPKMMELWPDARFIGLSATPWAKGMGLLWDDLQIGSTLTELIDAGTLSKFTAYAPSNPDLSTVKTVRGDYAEGDLEREMSKPAIVGSVVGTWLERGENRPTLCFAVNIAHSQVLREQFERAGISAEHVDHQVDSVERRLIERRFRSGAVKIVCSVRTMTTGIDWPVSCIIDAAPTRSEMLHCQKIGRGLRVNPGTEDCVILDHAGNSLRLGLVTDIHHAELDETPSNEKQPAKATEKLPKPCSVCEVLFLGLICPACGHERKPIPGIENVDGELVEIGKKRTHTMAEKQEFWSMALWLDDDRAKGGKLAKGLYKGKFGVWPQGLTHFRKYPDAAFWNYEKSSRIRYAKRMAKQQKM